MGEPESGTARTLGPAGFDWRVDRACSLVACRPSLLRLPDNHHSPQLQDPRTPRARCLLRSLRVRSLATFALTTTLAARPEAPFHLSHPAGSCCSVPQHTASPPKHTTPKRHHQHSTMGFGDFTTLCAKASIPLCALVGHQEINGGAGIQTKCYARTIEIANTLIFQAANDFMHILALIMTVVMIIHVRSKFTAVGM